MASFDALKEMLIQRLYERANEPAADSEMSEVQITEFLVDQTGLGIANQVLSELLDGGLLLQTRAANEQGDAFFEVTAKLIRLAERLRRPESSDDRPARFSEFRDQVLVALAKEEERESGADFIDLKVVADKNDLQYKEGWVRKAAIGFRDMGYVQDAFSMSSETDGGFNVALTGDGLAAAEELETVEDISTDAEPKFELVGDDDTVTDDDGMPLIAVPASDRTVPLDHNSPAYSDVVEKLEELKRAVESNNEYRDTDLEDHERRLTDVESTLKLLENKRVNVNAIKAVAFGTLVYLAEKFAEHPIGELAKAAWDSLKALLGL